MGWIFIPLLRLLAWSYALQPLALQRAYGRWIGALIRWSGYRAKVIRSNLELAFPGERHQEYRKDVLKKNYQHLGTLFCEILLLFGPMRFWVSRNVEIRGGENCMKALTRGRGCFFLASHVGNWEVMAATAEVIGFEILLVTKHLKPEWLHRAIEAGRQKIGIRATYEPKTMRDIMRQLRKNQAVGFILDQYAGPPVGVRVPFFGVPVGTSMALATLAKRTGASVLPVVNYRSKGKVIVDIRPPVEWSPGKNPQLELAENTASYAAKIEEDVREHPEQWLWTHRRFKGDLSPLRQGEWNEGRSRRS